MDWTLRRWVKRCVGGKSSRFIGIACANATTSGSVLGNLAILQFLSKNYVFLLHRYQLFLVCSCSHYIAVFSLFSIAISTAELSSSPAG